MTIEKVNESFEDFAESLNEAKLSTKTLKDLKLDLETAFDGDGDGDDDALKFANLRKTNAKDVSDLESFIVHVASFVEKHPELKDTSVLSTFGPSKKEDKELSSEFDKWVDKSKFDFRKNQKVLGTPIADLDLWDHIESIMKALIK